MNLGFFSNRRKAPSHSQSPVGKRPAATPEPRCGAVRGDSGEPLLAGTIQTL